MRTIATLHSDQGTMLAELPQATNTNRLFTVSGRGAFSLDVPTSDAGAALLTEGQRVVIWSQRTNPYVVASNEAAAAAYANGYISSANYQWARPFVMPLTAGGRLVSVDLPLRRVGSTPTGNLGVTLRADDGTGKPLGGAPGLLATSSTTVDVSTLTTAEVWYTFLFPAVALVAGTVYHICWDTSGLTQTVSKYVLWYASAATAINRSYSNDAAATWTMQTGQPDLKLRLNITNCSGPIPCSPPYVGYVGQIEEDTFARVYKISGDNQASVFYARNLPQDCKFVNQTAGGIAMRLLQFANAPNSTGILPSPVAVAGSPVRGTFDASGATLGDALDKLSDQTGDDWWLDEVVSRNQITTYLAWGDRGADRSASVVLEEGIHFTKSAYVRDILGKAKSATAIGGTGAMPDRTSAIQTTAPIGVNYGVALNREISDYLPLDEDESVLSDAAAKMLTRPPTAAETLTLTINSVADWGSFGPGDIVRVVLPNAGAGGVDRHVRIIAVQPDEASGEEDLAVEIL